MPSLARAPYEDREHDLAIKDFLGVNTQAERTAIHQDEFAWLENIMPIGHGNLRVVPYQGEPVAAMPSGTLSYWKYINLNNIDFLAIFGTDGAGRMMNLATYAFTTIAGPGTFTLPKCAQWDNNVLLIVDANDYRIWNGTAIIRNGVVDRVEILTPGSGYTAVATVAFAGGAGSGAAGTVAMQLIGAQAVTAGGAGYVVGDILTLAGGTHTVLGQFRVDTVAAGVVTAVSVYEGGSYTVLPAAPNAVTGGTGAGCTITHAWGVESVTMTNYGNIKYTSAPTVTFSAGGVTATGDAFIVIGPVNGAHIATFAGRVWVARGRVIEYSAPDSYTDFTTANGGGSVTVTDETLKSDITGMLVANNFLYYWGDASIAVISDVRVTAGGITIFSNNNVSPIIGSKIPASIFPYYRDIAFATPFGFYALVGASPRKLSDALDGAFDLIDFAQPVSGAVVVLHKILCMAFLFTYDDPEDIERGPRGLLAIYFNKKWFFAAQGDGLTLIQGGFQAGTPALFGTDGTSIYKLFSDIESAISTKLVTPLWPMGKPTRTKQTLKAGVELTARDVITELDVTIDTDSASYASQLVADNLGQWANTAGTAGQWSNTLGVLGNWITIGFQIFQGNIEAYGRYVGYTITSRAPQFKINGLLMQTELKANWATKAT